MPKQFLTTSTAEFLGLQSGNARPYFYIEAIISGTTSILGDSYTSTNWVVDGGVIDRERPVLPGDRSNIFSSDVTVELDNSTRRFCPDVTGSVFFGNDYLESPVNYWAGFVNISGTSMLLQRGSFVIDDLRLDSRSTVAFLRLRDKFKRALSSEIGRDVSGTATPLIFTGSQNARTIIESLLVSAAALTAGDLDLQTASVSFVDLSLSEQNVAQAISLISEASDGFIYTSRDGKLTFRTNEPVFGTAVTNLTAKDSDFIINSFFEQTKDNRLNKVTVDFRSGTSVSVIAQTTGVTANATVISNDVIQNTSDALALAQRTLDRFSGQVTTLQLDAIFFPTIELGHKLDIYSTGIGLIARRFELYKIQEEPTNGTMRLFLINEDRVTGKWTFFSDTSATYSATFTGGVGTESGGWQAGWGFFAQTSGAETTAGFDTDGNNNGIIESGVTSSGVGGTGIEVGFMFF